MSFASESDTLVVKFASGAPELKLQLSDEERKSLLATVERTTMTPRPNDGLRLSPDGCVFSYLLDENGIAHLRHTSHGKLPLHCELDLRLQLDLLQVLRDAA